MNEREGRNLESNCPCLECVRFREANYNDEEGRASFALGLFVAFVVAFGVHAIAGPPLCGTVLVFVVVVALVWGICLFTNVEVVWNNAESKERNRTTDESSGPREEATKQARYLLSKQRLLVLDTETTGTGPRAEICEIAIVDRAGEVVVDELLRPRTRMSVSATRIHGIRTADVEEKPTCDLFIGSTLSKILEDSDVPIAIFNSEFDLRLLDQSTDRGTAWRSRKNVFCIMRMYAHYYGKWNDYHQSFRWQGLDKARRQCRLEWDGKPHRALPDARMALAVLRHMADSPG